MEEMNIPLYRAKRIDSDGYVIGYLTSSSGYFGIKYYLTKGHNQEIIEIEPTTLAIYFPNNLDSQGNKIFVSLREDGKGGDLCETDNGARFGVFIWHKYAMCIDLKCTKVVDWKSEFKELRPQEYKTRTKVIGIQE